MELFKEYIILRKNIFVIYVLSFLFWVFVAFLYGDSIKSLMYIWFLFTLVLFIYLIYDYFRYKKHIKYLKYFVEKDFYNLELLPDSKDIYKKYYYRIIERLFNEKKELVLQNELKYQEIIDYYTLWVHQVKIPLQALKLLSDDYKISHQVLKLEQYVDMALNYLRADFINNDLLIKRYSLDEIIKTTVKKYSDIFIGKNLILEYQSLNVEIITDAKWFGFILEQLLSNALKYTRKGVIKIYLEDYFLVFEDTGIGIKKEDLKRIFEKGYTGYNGRNYQKSTGIGLYLVKKILNKLNYQISVESQLNVGTKFKIDLKDNITKM